MHPRWALAIVVALLLGALAPAGDSEGPHDARSTTGRIAGQLAAVLLVGSIATTHFARGRLATRLHVGGGVAILALVVVHLALLLVAGITHGWLPGLLSLALLATHGWLGLRKRALLRARGAAWWRGTHLWTGWGAALLAAEHALLFGRHWGLLSGLLPE